MKKNTIFWLLGKVRNRVPAMILLILARMGHALLSVLLALGMREVIDSAVARDAMRFREAAICQILIIAGILLCMTVARHLKERLSADVEMDWKKRLLYGLLHGEYAKVSSYHSGELLNRLNNDVVKVNEGILNVLPAFLAMLVRLVAAVAVLGALDGLFTVVILSAGAVVIVVTGVMRRCLKRLNKRVSEHDGKVSGFLQEIMEKLLMVQSMDVSAEVESRTDDLLQQRYDVQRKRKNVLVLSNTGISVLSYGAAFFALIWCAGQMLQGSMSFGSLTAITQLVNQLQRPFVDLSGILPQYAAMSASAERLMELEEICADAEVICKDANALYEKMEAIEATDLIFSYDRSPVLTDAEFRLPKGAFAVITGPSGIGKSTILKLLLGIFTPEQGTLSVRLQEENVPLDRSTRRLFAYVPQGNLLLSGTLRDNLTIIKPKASAEEIEKAVYVSTMDEFLPQLPNGLDTVLGESGAGLSEGQAQRLAIARAVLGGAPILLLDECTSALDPETERKVLYRLKELPGRTCIAVTHRTAALEICDLRLEVDDGRVRVL